MMRCSRAGVIPLAKAGTLPIVLLLLVWAATTECAPPEKPPVLSPKDFVVLPFCNTLSTKKLDSKKERIFDELKVTTSNRIRIHGKKVHDAGWVGQALHYHLGKVVLAPWHDRTGTLSAKIPSGSDSISYYIALDMGNALRTKWVTLEKGKMYPWTLKSEGGVRKFAVFDGSKEIAVLSAPATDVAGFGFAATARWPGNEVDAAAEFD